MRQHERNEDSSHGGIGEANRLSRSSRAPALAIRESIPAVRMLHLACMPFPSPQGTQGLVRAMLDALAEAGHDVHLLTYAAGSGPPPEDWSHHRVGNWPQVTSLRSGHSVGKILLDVRMVAHASSLSRRLRPDAIIAHNVEAALVARAAGLHPRIYMAHTRFDTELRTYTSLPGPWERLGAMLDAGAARADKVMAITPNLAAHLDASFVMPPWSVSAPISAAERVEARAGLRGEVLLYAGNLDGYQGVEHVVEASHGRTLILATESQATFVQPHVRVWPLANERDRRRAHAACDLVVVPRRSPGGLPIKLLDALGRGVPVVAQRRALAGLTPAGVLVADDDDPAALHRAIDRVSADPPRGGRNWIADVCAPKHFVTAFERALRPMR